MNVAQDVRVPEVSTEESETFVLAAGLASCLKCRRVIWVSNLWNHACYKKKAEPRRRSRRRRK